MTLTIYRELEQGTPEWLAARAGIITASAVGQLITAKTLKVARNDYSRGLMTSLIAERITGHVDVMFTNADMARGHMEEPLARDLYATHEGVEVEEVGFMVREFEGLRLGYSPDGLVGDDGLIEIKSRRQKKQVSTILSDEVPVENLAQLQTGLLVSGRQWIDYCSYSNGMAMWVKRVYPDLAWQDAILSALKEFEATATEQTAAYERAVAGLPVAERIDYEMEITF